MSNHRSQSVIFQAVNKEKAEGNAKIKAEQNQHKVKLKQGIDHHPERPHCRNILMSTNHFKNETHNKSIYCVNT